MNPQKIELGSGPYFVVSVDDYLKINRVDTLEDILAQQSVSLNQAKAAYDKVAGEKDELREKLDAIVDAIEGKELKLPWKRYDGLNWDNEPYLGLMGDGAFCELEGTEPETGDLFLSLSALESTIPTELLEGEEVQEEAAKDYPFKVWPEECPEQGDDIVLFTREGGRSDRYYTHCSGDLDDLEENPVWLYAHEVKDFDNQAKAAKALYAEPNTDSQEQPLSLEEQIQHLSDRLARIEAGILEQKAM